MRFANTTLGSSSEIKSLASVFLIIQSPIILAVFSFWGLLVTRAEGAEARFRLCLFLFLSVSRCSAHALREISLSLVAKVQILWHESVTTSELLAACGVGRYQNRLEIDVFLAFIVLCFFPRHSHYINTSLLSKRRSISRSPHSKLFSNSGVLYFDGELLFVFQKCLKPCLQGTN